MHEKSNLAKAHQPCPHCSSSDAYSLYDDGHGYCFSCNTYTPSEGNLEVVSDINKQTFEYVSWRGISRDTMQYYDVKTAVNTDGEPVAIHFPYANGRTKVRTDGKTFKTIGTANKENYRLFGMDKFPGGKYVTITEGELDAMSVFQMMGSQYPVVSVGSASMAKKDIRSDYEYLNAFERIYICFDSDPTGQEAAHEIARMFDFNKVYLVSMDKYKDANDYLQNDDTNLFQKTWWGARRFLPENIISSYNEIDTIIDNDTEKPAVPYPYAILQEMTYGIRGGEFVLFKAMEGIGKTEVFRSLEHHLLKETNDNIGIIHLEESKPRIIKGLVGYELETPVHLPDSQVSKEEIKATYRQATGRDERVNIYSHFGSDDPDVILNTIRFMVASCGCKYVFLDHITMVVTGLYGEDERRALDYISTRLAMMVEELDFTLFIVSHVNDEGQTRGSRNISKVADLVINLYRDKLSPDPDTRNLTRMEIEKNRYAGRTGPSSSLRFDPSTFVIREELEIPL